MNFVPILKESLEKISFIYYTFSTKVNPSDLNNISLAKTEDIIVRELLILGYY